MVDHTLKLLFITFFLVAQFNFLPQKFDCCIKVRINCFPFTRQAIEEGEEALKREQTKVHELQQQLEQERDLTVRQHKQGEERKEVKYYSRYKYNGVYCIKMYCIFN